MSKQRTDNERYRIYYGVDDNAALEPEYIPTRRSRQHEEEERRARRERNARERNRRQLRLGEIKSYAFVALVAVTIALAGGYVLARNATIYKNVQTIRSLAKEKQTIQTKINDVEKEMSATCELSAFYDMAENELNLVEADSGNVITVVCPADTNVAVDETEESIDFFDSTIDIISSLERRIKNWF